MSLSYAAGCSAKYKPEVLPADYECYVQIHTLLHVLQCQLSDKSHIGSSQGDNRDAR
jgi:hypothetical protein